MQLTSSSFGQNSPIPPKFTCDGADTSPALSISGVPPEAKSLALIMRDPDVSEAGKQRLGVDVIVHWVRFGIPADTKEIKEGEEPGTPGSNTFEKGTYMGPCPPDREHRYIFTLYAFDDYNVLFEHAPTADDLLSAMEGHIIAKTELIGRYNRPGNTQK